MECYCNCYCLKEANNKEKQREKKYMRILNTEQLMPMIILCHIQNEDEKK